MTPKDTVQSYFGRLTQRDDWPALFTDSVVFTSFTSPVKRVSGKAAFLESTKRFYSMIAAVDVRDLLVDGDKVCALTSYSLKTPAGAEIKSDVAELFQVRNGRITAFDIYFDSAPFPK